MPLPEPERGGAQSGRPGNRADRGRVDSVGTRIIAKSGRACGCNRIDANSACCVPVGLGVPAHGEGIDAGCACEDTYAYGIEAIDTHRIADGDRAVARCTVGTAQRHAVIAIRRGAVTDGDGVAAGRRTAASLILCLGRCGEAERGDRGQAAEHAGRAHATGQSRTHAGAASQCSQTHILATESKNPVSHAQHRHQAAPHRAAVGRARDPVSDKA